LRTDVRFFVDKEKEPSAEYLNIPIPQLKSTVSINHELLKVKNIEYHYTNFEKDYDVVNVFVEHMEDEDYADFD